MKNPAPADHPIDELIEQRWSPRAFDPRPIPPEDLRSVLEAAGWAASAFNEPPWRFIVARREETAEFARMLDCLVEGNQLWARNAGALMLTAVASSFERNGKPGSVDELPENLRAGETAPRVRNPQNE